MYKEINAVMLPFPVAGKFLDKIDFWIVFYELIFYVPHIRKDKMKKVL